MADPIRLPSPGGDDGVWGGLLNDYLQVAHNSDGTLKPNGVGDYISVNTGNQTFTDGDAPQYVVFEDSYASRGDSIAWDVSSDAEFLTVQSNGVYAISASIDWNDFSNIDAIGGIRFAEIWCNCMFRTTDVRQAVADDTYNYTTTLTLNFTCFLQAGQKISLRLRQEASSTDLIPWVQMLVTKIAHETSPPSP